MGRQQRVKEMAFSLFIYSRIYTFCTNYISNMEPEFVESGVSD